MKKIIEKIKNSKDNIILIVFAVYMLNTILESTVLGYINDTFSSISKIIRYACYLVFALNIFGDWKNGKKITWTMILATCISVVVYIFSKNRYLTILVIVMIGLKNINTNKLIKIAYYTNLIAFIFITVLSLLGVMPDWTFQRENMKLRHSLGFNYPTITSTYFFFLVLMKFYLEKDNIRVFKLIIESIVAIILYLLTDSKTGLILTFVVIITTVIIKMLKKYKKVLKLNKYVKKLICCIPTILVILILILAIFYTSGLFNKLDNLLSGRIYYANQAIKNYKIPLFGKEIVWYGWGGYGYIEQENFFYNYVDISYMKIVFDCGIVTLILFIISYTTVLKEKIEKNEYYDVYILLLVLIWGAIEPNILNISINVFILLLNSIFEYGTINALNYKNIIKREK